VLVAAVVTELPDWKITWTGEWWANWVYQYR
jgi:hypothetical protein